MYKHTRLVSNLNARTDHSVIRRVFQWKLSWGRIKLRRRTGVPPPGASATSSAPTHHQALWARVLPAALEMGATAPVKAWQRTRPRRLTGRHRRTDVRQGAPKQQEILGPCPRGVLGHGELRQQGFNNRSNNLQADVSRLHQLTHGSPIPRRDATNSLDFKPATAETATI